MKRTLVHLAWLTFLAAACTVNGYNFGKREATREQIALVKDFSVSLEMERRIGRNDAVIQIREYLGARGEANAKRLVLDWWSEQLQKERKQILSAAGAEGRP